MKKTRKKYKKKQNSKIRIKAGSNSENKNIKRIRLNPSINIFNSSRESFIDNTLIEEKLKIIK